MAALKIKEFPGLQRIAPETIEKAFNGASIAATRNMRLICSFTI